MTDFWLDMSNSPLYKDWIGGVLEGLFVKGGVYNSKPLNDFLQTELSDISTMERWVNVGLTDIA